MSRNARTSRNRYKKENGKGATALAVFIALILLLLLGGYYFLAWQQKPAPVVRLQQLARPVVPAAPAQPRRSSALASVPAPMVTPPAVVGGGNGEEAHKGHDALPTAVPVSRTGGRAELAIIVDDMGSSLQEVRSLMAIGVPLTVSVIPGLRHDGEVAAFAAGHGAEVMLHIPMQSKEYPQRRMESNGLLLSYDEQQLQTLVNSYVDRVPQAVGANNHMGSAFTEDEAQMRRVLTLLKQKGLFFIDSVTTPATTGPRVAAALHMKSARRDVFLDNEQNEGYIRGQLNIAVAKARKNGRAIAICHPHPTTLATLAKVLPGLSQQGVTLVVVSKLVR